MSELFIWARHGEWLPAQNWWFIRFLGDGASVKTWLLTPKGALGLHQVASGVLDWPIWATLAFGGAILVAIWALIMNETQSGRIRFALRDDEDLKDRILIYIIAVVIAAIFVWIDLRLFALYFFMVAVYMIAHAVESLDALIRVSHTISLMRTTAVAKALGVSDQDLDDMIDEAAKASPQVRSALGKEMRKAGMSVADDEDDEDEDDWRGQKAAGAKDDDDQGPGGV